MLKYREKFPEQLKTSQKPGYFGAKTVYYKKECIYEKF